MLKLKTTGKSILKQLLEMVNKRDKTPFIEPNFGSETTPEKQVKQLYESNSDLITQLLNNNQLEREYIRNKATQPERYFYHQLAKILKQEIFTAREKLGEEYIASNKEFLLNPNFSIEARAGIAVTSLKNYAPFSAALAEAEEIIAARKDNDLLSKGSLDFLASSKKDFDNNSALTKLALDPNLVIPITGYFGCLPILFGFDINRARSKEILNWSSHMYHLDPEDIKQIKVFIYLTDVDENSGPFTALPADKSKVVTEKLNYKIGRLSDKEVSKIVGEGEEKVCLGEQGTTVFCDTNSCLHYGGRIKERERYVMTIYYALPTSTWFPLFPGDGEKRNLTPLLKARENNELEKALLGEEFLLPDEVALARYEEFKGLVNMG
jgi:hypothetical protein